MELTAKRLLSVAAMLFVLFAGEVVRADDLALIEQLEAQTTRGEKQQTLRTIASRLVEAPPMAAELQLRLLRHAASSELLADQIDSLLRQIHPEIQPAAIADALAGGLNSAAIFRMPGTADLVMPALREAQPFSDAVFTNLIAALDNVAMSNREIAIQALSAATPDSPQFLTTVDALTVLLATHEHSSTRSAAVKGLVALFSPRPFSSEPAETIQRVALTDTYMSVRMDAFEALANQPLVDSDREALSRSLSAEIVRPTALVWQNARGLRQYNGLRPRAIEFLDSWHEPPYPHYVTEAFIATAGEWQLERSLEILAAVQSRAELTVPEQEALAKRAAASSNVEAREAIYRVLNEVTSPEAAADAADILVDDDAEFGARLRAGYGLLVYHRDEPVPTRVEDIAGGILRSTNNREFRGIAARLISQSDATPADREAELIAVVRQPGFESFLEVAHALLEMGEGVSAEDLVNRHFADTTLAFGFRVELARHLETTGDRTQPLKPTTVEALKRGATAGSDYWLRDAAIGVLEAWQLAVPLRVRLSTMEAHYRMLSLAWIVSAILGAGACLMAFAQVFQRKTRLGKVGAVVGLVFLIGLLLVTILIGVIGSLGHNSGPPPSRVFAANLPFFLTASCAAAYFLVTWLIKRRSVPVAQSPASETFSRSRQ